MEKEYNKYLWSPKQPRVYGISPLTISGTPMSEEDVATSLKVENSQQRFQQNPIVKRSEQWEAQQKQREEEIAASKKWLELHPEDESDSPYTILERGKHQAIVDGKDPSYYEKMIDDGKQFTKGALAVLSLPYLSAAAAGAYGYGASLGARGLFTAQGIHGLANENGIRKTANLIKSGDYGRAALSGAGDALNAAMILPGVKLLGNAAKFLGSTAKYGLKSTVAGNMLSKNVRYNTPNMETVADYTNKQIFDNLMKYPDKEYNDIPVYTDLNTMKIKKVKNPELVKFEFWPDKFGDPVQLKKATDEFGNEVFLHSFDRNQGSYVDNTPLNRDQKFIHYRASEGYDGKTLFPKADNKVDPVGHIWFNANSSAHSFPDKYKLEHFAIDPIPSTGHPWSKSFRLVSDPVDVSNAIHTKYNPITLGLETQIKPFTPLKNTSMDKTSYAFFERPSKLSEAELKGIPKSVRNQPIRESTFDTRASNDIIETYSNGSWRTTRPFTEEQILAEKNPEVQSNMKYSLEKWKKDNSNIYENYIDDTSKFNTDLQEYINSLNIEPSSRYLDGELIDGVRETNPFVKLYRQYLYNNGTDASSISNTDLAKLLTAQEQEIRSGMTGVMADKSPLWHGSNSLFDTFDWQKYASINTKNAGALGPGNYFSTQGVPYGFDRNLKRVRNMQPYFITDIRSTPSGRMMQNKGLLPEYHGEYELVHNPEWLQQEVKRIVPGQNTTLYIDYNEPMSGIMDVTRGAGMLRRNTGIKSLFPHPSRLVRGEDGLLKMLPTNWADPRVNFKQGGILKRVESGKSGIHIKPENRGKFTALKKRTGKSSTWYKEHGTPAQKKMAVFALNARKWKHK